MAFCVQFKRRAMVILAFSAGAVASFAALALNVDERQILAMNAAVRTVVAGVQSSLLHSVFSALSCAGSVAVLGPMAAVAILWVWRRGASDRSALAGVMSMSSVLVTFTLKAIFHRARPLGAGAFPELGYSFPSGHSLNTMAIGVTVAYVSYREGLAPRWVVSAAVIFSLLVGVSRVYLDVHWATDVIGGWSVGAVIAAACALFYEWPHSARDLAPTSCDDGEGSNV